MKIKKIDNFFIFFSFFNLYFQQLTYLFSKSIKILWKNPLQRPKRNKEFSAHSTPLTTKMTNFLNVSLNSAKIKGRTWLAHLLVCGLKVDILWIQELDLNLPGISPARPTKI